MNPCEARVCPSASRGFAFKRFFFLFRSVVLRGCLRNTLNQTIESFMWLIMIVIFTIHKTKRVKLMNKLYLILVLAANALGAHAASMQTNICISNKSGVSHRLDVLPVDNTYWDGKSRPDMNLAGVTIKPGEKLCRREEVNTLVTVVSFTLTVDGAETVLYTKDKMKWYAIQTIANPNAVWGSAPKSNNIMNLAGGACDSVNCSEFFIKQDLAPSESWMASIGNDVRINKITIPGTHGSAATDGENAPKDTFLNQYIGDEATLFKNGYDWSPRMDITAQLKSGVRFLDMRIRRVTGGCALHHGKVYLKKSCNDLFKEVYDFLDRNPSETILVSIKEEVPAMDATLTVEQTINKLIDEQPKYWSVGRKIPTLGINSTDSGVVEASNTNIRGRIVLVRRYVAPEKSYGINAGGWPDNTSGLTTNGLLNIQDAYNVSEVEKENQFRAQARLIKKTDFTLPDSPLFINFSSGYKGLIPFPYDYSKTINPKLRSYFTLRRTGNYGVIMSDFVTPELIKKLYSTNFVSGWDPS